MQKSLIYIDVNTKAQVLESGTFVNKTADMPTIERGQWQILCVQFVSRTVDEYGTVTLTEAPLNSSSSYVVTADNDFDDDNNLMFKSYQSVTPFDESEPTSNRINIAGDWIDGTTAELSKGQMSIRVNADTAKFVEVLGSAKTKTNMYINIKQYTEGLSNPSTIAWFNFVAQNTVRDWGEPEELVPEGSTIIPFINSFLSQPLDLQYSVDGSTDWHEVQTDTDRYFRMKFASVETQWSDITKLPIGAAATIAVGTVASGDTADVTNSGTTTDAVFDFVLPKGDKGDKGDIGDSATVTVGTVTTGLPGTDATVTNVGTATAAVFNFTIPQGDTGDVGAAATIEIGSVTTGLPGTEATVTNVGTSHAAVLNFDIPRGAAFTIDATGLLADRAQYDAELKGFSFLATDTGSIYIKNSDTFADWSDPIPFKGDKGDTGATGATGEKGDAATIEIGSVTSGDTPSVTNSGTSYAAVFDFVLQKGDKGDKGDKGEQGIQGIQGEQGIQGIQGERGAAFTIDATGLLADRAQYDAELKGFSFLATDDGNVYVKNSDASADWSDPIPFKGDKGDSGTISIGSVTSGTEASITNSGTITDAVFDFILPKGDKGDKGDDGVNVGQYFDVTELTDSAYLSIASTSVPVWIKAPSGKLYPIEKGTITNNGVVWLIESAPYLAYENTATFAGIWRVYMSGGIKGEGMEINAAGVTADRSQYDGEAYLFSFFDTAEGLLYIKLSDTSGDWSEGVPFQGERGAAATIVIGNVTSGDTASVTNSGTNTDAVFDFILPKGNAATIQIGSVSTIEHGSEATVNNSGTAYNAVFDFEIPTGYVPIRGTDYWTESDIAEIKAYVDEVILNGEW